MKYYIDLTASDGPMAVLFTHRENEAVYVGTTVHIEPEKLRNHPLAMRYVSECDFHFFFQGDDLPTLYTVPQMEIAGRDSQGGLFAMGPGFSLEDGPLYYIDREKRCFLAAETGESLLKLGMEWRSRMAPTDAVEVYADRAEAERNYKIWNWEDLLKEGDL
ncbi:MAG: hypothetical protein IJ960_07025 [Oscillospiraceae bacterium]|nr:hypothetical protein [Oscillospiraceae bacterium]